MSFFYFFLVFFGGLKIICIFAAEILFGTMANMEGRFLGGGLFYDSIELLKAFCVDLDLFFRSGVSGGVFGVSFYALQDIPNIPRCCECHRPETRRQMRRLR